MRPDEDELEEERIMEAVALRAEDPERAKAFAQSESEFFAKLDAEVRAGKRCPHCFQNLHRLKEVGGEPNLCDGTCLA